MSAPASTSTLTASTGRCARPSSGVSPVGGRLGFSRPLAKTLAIVARPFLAPAERASKCSRVVFAPGPPQDTMSCHCAQPPVARSCRLLRALTSTFCLRGSARLTCPCLPRHQPKTPAAPWKRDKAGAGQHHARTATTIKGRLTFIVTPTTWPGRPAAASGSSECSTESRARSRMSGSRSARRRN